MSTKLLEEARKVIDDRKLLEKPFSEETKNTILEMVERMSYREMWQFGSQIEEKIRDFQLSEKTGRTTLIRFSWDKGKPVNKRKAAMRLWLTFSNLRFIWEALHEKCAMAKLPGVSCLEKEPPVLYHVECGCGKTTQVETVGPFSALKIVNSFPIDDFSRYGFWDHKHGARTTADEQCYCYEDLTVQEA